MYIMSFEDYSTQGVQPEVHVVAGRVIHGIPVSQITEGPPFIGMYSQIIDDIFVDMGSIRISQTMPHPLILLGSSLPTLLTGTTAPNTQHIFPLNIITIDPDPIVRLTIQPPEAQTAQHANYLAEYFRIAKQFVLNRLTSLIAQVDGGSTVRLGPIMTQAHGAPIVMPSGTIAWGRDQRGYIVKSAGIAKECTEPSSEEIWTGFLDKKAMALTLLFADIITLMLLRHRYEILLRQSAPPHI